jgi:hypothetical protein
MNKFVTAAVAAGAAVAATITGANIVDGSIWQSDMAPAVDQVYKTTYNNTVGFPALQAPVADALNFGKQVASKDVPPTVITNIGGKFADRATNAGTISVPAGGLYEVRGQYRIERTANGGNAAVRPQVALRYGTDLKDAGTAMGVEISKLAGREIVGATFGQVDTRQATGLTEVTVYFFGYADDSSDEGSGQLKGSGSFKVVRVG